MSCPLSSIQILTPNKCVLSARATAVPCMHTLLRVHCRRASAPLARTRTHGIPSNHQPSFMPAGKHLSNAACARRLLAASAPCARSCPRRLFCPSHSIYIVAPLTGRSACVQAAGGPAAGMPQRLWPGPVRGAAPHAARRPRYAPAAC